MNTCPECGTQLGPESGIDTYKHAIGCLHLPNEGVERLLARFEGKDDERSRRVVRILRAVRAEEEV